MQVVDRLDPVDVYDVVLVVLPKQRIAEVLPVLAANDRTPSVMFFGNNAAGPAAMTDALGHDRVLLGFPGAAGVPHEGAIRYVITSAQEQPTTLGELDGSKSERIVAIASALEEIGVPRVGVHEHRRLAEDPRGQDSPHRVRAVSGGRPSGAVG